MRYFKGSDFCFTSIIFLTVVQSAMSTPEPLLSQSGMVPMRSSAAPKLDEEPEQERTNLVSLTKAQGVTISPAKDPAEQQFNVLLSSFPSEEPLSVIKPDRVSESKILQKPLKPKISTSPQTFTVKPQILSTARVRNIETQTKVYHQPLNQNPVKPKVSDLKVGRRVDSNNANFLKADEIEKDIIAQSLSEDINRKVVINPITKSYNHPPIRANLIQRQATQNVQDDVKDNKNGTLFEHPNEIKGRKGSRKTPFYRPGPPWEDETIVGKILEVLPVAPVEVSFTAALKLCRMRKKLKDLPAFMNEPERYYLWAPINQYVPLIHKAFPIRPPVFARQCLKWVLRACRGETKRPLFKPCTYWAPKPIRRVECGFLPNTKTKIINYRPLYFVPGNCPCIWPCTRRFDPIQRCRVETSEDERHQDPIHADGDPWHEGELRIQESLADQLCRAMKLTMSTKQVMPIGWIPMRIDSMIKSGASQTLIPTTKKPDEVENTLQFRRKRDTAFQKKIKSNRSGEPETNENISSVKKKRQSDPIQFRFYNPDVMRQSGSKNILTSRSEPEMPGTDPNDNKVDAGEGKAEGEEAGKGDDISFAAMGNYDPESHADRGRLGDVDLNRPRCIEWMYKACPKSKGSSEEIHSPATEEGQLQEPIARRSIHYQQRRKMQNENKETTQEQKYEAVESVSRLTKRHHDNKTAEFFTNVLDADGDKAGHACGEWYYSETTHCLPEERVEVTRHISSFLITGVINSSESEEDYNYNTDDKPAQKEKLRTVKDLCPGSLGKFPCFLKRKKRAAGVPNATIKTAGITASGNDSHEVEVVEYPTDENNDVDSSTTKDAEQTKEMIQRSSVYFVNHIQMSYDSACICEWPCLPFFDKFNRCYDASGKVNKAKQRKIHRSFRQAQRAPVVCINFVEIDDIYCKIKDK